jgi:hypothetical protein
VPTFAWAPVVGADHYEVQVDDMTARHVGVLQNLNAPPNPWTPRTPLTRGHIYRWRVRAVGATGPGPWSSYLGFRVE